MAGRPLSSGIDSVFRMGKSVQAWREAQWAQHDSRGRGGELGAGFQPAD
jgi:hypothetical protein